MTPEQFPERAPRALPFWGGLIGIVLLSTLLQIGALWGELVLDDHLILKDQPFRGCNADPLDCFRHPQFQIYYRPLFMASFVFSQRWVGLNPFPYHLENLLLHTLVVGQVVWLYRALFRNETTALLGGLLFGLHPLQVCVTTFIGGRTDTLALFFLGWFLIGLIQSEAAPQSRWAWRSLSLLSFAGAVFTKEQSLMTLALAPLALALAQQRRVTIRPWMTLYLPPVVVYLILARRLIPAGAIVAPPWSLSLHSEMVGRTLWYYVKTLSGLLHAPIHQSTLGEWDSPQWGAAALGYLCLGAWCATLGATWRNRPLRFCFLWTTLALLPCLNLFLTPSQAVAPYRAYLPLVGLCGLLGAAATQWLATEGRRKIVGQAALACLGVLYGVRTVADVAVWRSEERVLRWKVQADSFLPAEIGLATKWRATNRPTEALNLLNDVMRRTFPGGRSEAELRAQFDRPETWRRIKSLSGMSYSTRRLMHRLLRERGLTLAALGRWGDATRDFQLALYLMPRDESSQDELAYCLLQQKQWERAEAILKPLDSVKPTALRAARLGYLDVQRNRWARANVSLQRAEAGAATLTPEERAWVQTLLQQTTQALAAQERGWSEEKRRPR